MNNLSYANPQLAFEWASKLSETHARESVANEWLRSEPVAARAAIDQSNLPAEVKARLLNTPNE